MDADDLHVAKLADHGVRLLGGGDEAVLGIAIDKDVELLLGREAGGDVAAGQQDFAKLAAVQVKTGTGFPDDGKQFAFAKDCHADKV